MNQNVEDYLAELMREALTDASISDVAVIKGTSSEIIEPDKDAVMVTCDELEGVVQTLRIAKCRVMVRTSSLSGDRVEHNVLADLITAVFHSALPPAFLLGVTGVDINGAHVTMNQTGTGEGKTWITEIQVNLGVNLNPSTSPLLSYDGKVLTYG